MNNTTNNNVNLPADDQPHVIVRVYEGVLSSTIDATINGKRQALKNELVNWKLLDTLNANGCPVIVQQVAMDDSITSQLAWLDSAPYKARARKLA